MAPAFQFPYLMGLPLLPSRRLIAVDAGSHSIKILLAERSGRNVRVLRRELINLGEEGLLSSEELGPALQGMLESLGDHPVALALPPHLPLSNILDLSAGTRAVKQLIEAETHKNRDLRDSPVVYDCAKLQPFGKHQNSFLVTLTKESDILDQISRLSIPKEDVCEVVAPANVLALAYQRTPDPYGHVALVDIGASGTLVTICVGGQAVHTATFPIGGNMFTETIATKLNLTVENAETAKLTKNLLTGPEQLPSLQAVFVAWRDELKRALESWLRENPELKLTSASFKLILSGGGTRQPGLLEFLGTDQSLRFEFWPANAVPGAGDVPEQFAIAWGTALQALGMGAHSASLLPATLREDWRGRRVHQYLLTCIFAVLAATALLLAIGTWQKYSAASRKEKMLQQAKLALEKAEETSVLKRDLVGRYERLRPVLRRQQRTFDTLAALKLLEQSRTNRNLWYVLFSDYPTYFGPRLTNNPAGRIQPGGTTNAPSHRNGFVAELCINQEGEAMRQTLGQVVSELKQSTLFTNVDTLPSDLRRDLARTNVVIPDRHFALALELAAPEFGPLPPELLRTNVSTVASPNKGTNRSAREVTR